jgi:hypothetical protein
MELTDRLSGDGGFNDLLFLDVVGKTIVTTIIFFEIRGGFGASQSIGICADTNAVIFACENAHA